MSILRVIESIDEEIARLEEAKSILTGEATTQNGTRRPGRPPSTGVYVNAIAKPAKAKKKRVLTAEGRKRIADAVRKRWATQKKATNQAIAATATASAAKKAVKPAKPAKKAPVKVVPKKALTPKDNGRTKIAAENPEVQE